MEDDTGDEEERGGLIPRFRRTKSWAHLASEYQLDIVVPLVVLSLLSFGVVAYNIMRKQWEPCDENKPLAKHFYCYNASRPPGFHIDAIVGRL